jgi:anti-sigma factor RsiW
MNHEAAVELLAEYARGTLGGAHRAAMETHLASCDECSGVVSLHQAIEREAGEFGPALFGSHLTPDALVALALSGASAPSADAAAMHAHIRACPPCAREWQVTQRAHREARLPWWQRALPRRLAPEAFALRVLAPACAVLLVALSLPAYRGLVEFPALEREKGRVAAEAQDLRARTEALQRDLDAARRRGGEARPFAGGVNVLVLAPATRDVPPAPPVLHLRAGQDVQPIVLGCKFSNEDAETRRIVLTIAREGETKPVWRYEARAADMWDPVNRLVAVLVPARVLTPGRYELVLVDAKSAATLYAASFVVARG